jgi:predicted Zn-dependent protease
MHNARCKPDSVSDRSTSSAATDLELMRASVLLDSDPMAAAHRARAILANIPQHGEANLLLAVACRLCGDLTTATSVLEYLVGAHPASPIMQLELGRTYAARGHSAEALAAFQRVVERDPTLADGWRELAAQCFLAGDARGGDVAYLKYAQLAPSEPQLHDAYVALTDNRLDPAEGVIRRRLQEAPHDPVALCLLADIFTRRGKDMLAEQYLTECLQYAPGYPVARYDLARLLYSQQRVAEVLPLIERLLATEPRNARYLSLKAQAIRLIGRSEEAVVLMEGVLADHPDDAQLWLLFGNLLREIGEHTRAIEAYRRSIAARPAFGEPYWSLANLKTFRFTAEEVETMQRQLARSPALGTSRIHLQFALGKAFEDASNFATSFEHYTRGNAAHRATIEYDDSATSSFMQRSKTLYGTGFFAARSGWGNERLDPIFIIGLPRSGSTLLEQMLASHSQVEGTRELVVLPAIVQEIVSRPKTTNSSEYPDLVASLGRTEIGQLAARYLSQTEAQRTSGKPRFVDKMLGNFAHVGLIHLMFPRAAIIDARRHPLGCSFSCYKQFFPRGMNFSYDLGEMGRYYRDYADLMRHIDAVLPGRVHRVYYEQLVSDPEREVRCLLDYCGLPFEAGCLRFYDNRRAVLTVSSEQVRRPIYPEGVDQWRHYDPWLQPLREALGNLIHEYPTDLQKSL